jgi:curli biogenesis system outer membrane secretion channel CsgG
VTRGPAARAVLALLLAPLAACTTGSLVTHGSGQALALAQAEPGIGGRYRIAVGAIIDKTGTGKEESLRRQLESLNTHRPAVAQLTADGVTAGIHDMLITGLFQADRFIVLERAALDAALTEQEFSVSARAGDATRIPRSQLEGAELVVVGALTAFDAGIGGAALPIPVPLGDRGDFGLMRLALKSGHVAMDLRVIDARTGRVLSSVATHGRHRRFGLDFDLHLSSPGSRVKLPGVLSYFQNTPVERALQEMVDLSVAHIAERVPATAPP